MKYTKEDIIQEYKNLKAHLGHSPSNKEFLAETGIDQRILGKLFGGSPYSKLVMECGDTPNVFNKQGTQIEHILTQWGTLVRKFGKIPPSVEWEHNNYKPTVDAIRKTHKLRWNEFSIKFLEYFSNNPEWLDVVHMIPIEKATLRAIQIAPITKIEGVEYEYDKYIPPIVRDLQELSFDKERANEFEKKLCLLFQMLGFEIDYYGQGTGRNPDLIAKSIKEHYAVIIDAKARTDSYKIGTEDRKFIEYINTYKPTLLGRGMNIIYFLVVSSKFDSASDTALKNISKATGVSTTLLTAQQLLKILSRKIEHPNKFDLQKLKDIFVVSGVISDKQLSKL